MSFKSYLAVGKVVDFTECLLPYLEARGDGIYVSGLFGGSNKVVIITGSVTDLGGSSKRVMSSLVFLYPHLMPCWTMQ